MVGSSSPGVHASDSFDGVGGGAGGRDESGVGLVEESGLEGFVSGGGAGVSHPAVASGGAGACIFFLWRLVGSFVELVREDAVRLPFILTRMKTCALKSLPLVCSEVAENRMRLCVPGVLMPVVIPLNHYVMKVLQHFYLICKY